MLIGCNLYKMYIIKKNIYFKTLPLRLPRIISSSLGSRLEWNASWH